MVQTTEMLCQGVFLPGCLVLLIRPNLIQIFNQLLRQCQTALFRSVYRISLEGKASST